MKALRNMKGITPIIAIIILLLITVAIAGAGYSYISMYTGGLINQQVEVTAATCSNTQAKIILKNIGASAVNTSGIRVMDAATGADITSAVTWSSSIADTGEVLELKFDENSATIRDTSGRGNHGTANGGATWTPAGKMGGAYAFDGAGDYVKVLDSDSLDMGMGNFTLGAWIKTAAAGTNQMRIFSKRDLSLIGYEMYISLNENNLSAFIGDTGGYTAFSLGNTNIRDTGWHHVVVTFSRQGNMTGYVDGAVQSAPRSIALRSGSVSNSYPLYVGIFQDGSGSPFNGIIDEVRVWNRALSAAEISELASNSVDVQPGGIATFTHTCLQPVCQYSIVYGGSLKLAYVNC
jgi:flagellin-like protein